MSSLNNDDNGIVFINIVIDAGWVALPVDGAVIEDYCDSLLRAKSPDLIPMKNNLLTPESAKNTFNKIKSRVSYFEEHVKSFLALSYEWSKNLSELVDSIHIQSEEMNLSSDPTLKHSLESLNMFSSSFQEMVFKPFVEQYERFVLPQVDILFNPFLNQIQQLLTQKRIAMQEKTDALNSMKICKGDNPELDEKLEHIRETLKSIDQMIEDQFKEQEKHQNNIFPALIQSLVSIIGEFLYSTTQCYLNKSLSNSNVKKEEKTKEDEEKEEEKVEEREREGEGEGEGEKEKEELKVNSVSIEQLEILMQEIIEYSEKQKQFNENLETLLPKSSSKPNPINSLSHNNNNNKSPKRLLPFISSSRSQSATIPLSTTTTTNINTAAGTNLLLSSPQPVPLPNTFELLSPDNNNIVLVDHSNDTLSLGSPLQQQQQFPSPPPLQLQQEQSTELQQQQPIQPQHPLFSSSSPLSLEEKENGKDNDDSNSFINAAKNSMRSSKLYTMIFDEENLLNKMTSLYGWGKLPFNDGSNILPYSHIQFPTDRNPICIKGGSEFLLFLTDKGDLFSYSWGSLSDICSGLEDVPGNSRDLPVIIPYFMLLRSLDHIIISQISCGLEHSLVLTKTGECYTWGIGNNGRLGLGDYRDYPIPQLVVALIDKQIVSISCGNAHNIVKTNRNDIYVWGRNNHGQLGLKDHTDRCVPTVLQNSNNSSGSSSNVNNKKIEHPFNLFTCGGDFSCFVDNDGVVYCTGRNNDGQCGQKNLQDVYIPTRIYGLPGIVQSISAGQNHILTLTTAKKLYAWGSCEFGQLGIGKNKSLSYKPQEVYFSDSVYKNNEIIKIECGSFHNIVLCKNGDLYGWGSNTNGCLGFGLSVGVDSLLVPTLIEYDKDKYKNDNDKNIVDINCMMNFSIIIKAKPELNLPCKCHNLPPINQEIINRRKYLQRKCLIYPETRRWYQSISHDWFSVKKTTSLLPFIKSGIPEDLRRVFWPKAIGNHLKITPDTYVLYRTRAQMDTFIRHIGQEEGELEEDLDPNDIDKEKSIQLIPTDVKRIFESLDLFGQNQPLHIRTKEVLEAYTYFRPDIGYVQGMCHVCALLTLHIPSNYLVFQCLSNLFASEHFIAFYSLKLNLIQEYYNVFDGIFGSHLKKLHNHFNTIGIKVDIFLFNWLQSMFLQCFPVSICGVIMDRFVVEGAPYLIRIALALLKLMSPHLLNTNFDECAMILRGRNTQNVIDEIISEKNLFDEVEKMTLSEREIRLLKQILKDVYFYDRNPESSYKEDNEYDLSLVDVYEAISSVI